MTWIMKNGHDYLIFVHERTNSRYKRKKGITKYKRNSGLVLQYKFCIFIKV
jgi:hypothetical protein